DDGHRHDLHAGRGECMVEEFILRGLRLNGADARPTIVQRSDQEFIPALLEDLRAGGDSLARAGATAISPRLANAPRLKLFQPVQRTFNIVLVDLACVRFGFPRVEPSRIESAGLVVRRLEVDRNGALTGNKQGWLSAGNRVRGWLNFGAAGQAKSWQE